MTIEKNISAVNFCSDIFYRNTHVIEYAHRLFYLFLNKNFNKIFRNTIFKCNDLFDLLVFTSRGQYLIFMNKPGIHEINHVGKQMAIG